MSVQTLVAAYWENLPLLSSEPGLALSEDLIKKVEEIFGFELIDLYRRVLNEALWCEIREVLTVDNLTESFFNACALKFLARLVESGIADRSYEDFKRLSEASEDKLRELRSICESIQNFLEKKIVESGFINPPEYVTYAISTLFERDMWIIERAKRFSFERFISTLIDKAPGDFLTFGLVAAYLMFTVVAILTVLFRRIDYRRANVEKLVEWCRDFAEQLSEVMRVLDTVLLSELLPPEEEVSVHIDLARRLLEEAKILIERAGSVQNDSSLQRVYLVQACEKLYKVAEECIKALAIMYRGKIPELEDKVFKKLERKRPKKWDTMLLRAAASSLAKVNEVVEFAWLKAYDVHVWCFHESVCDLGDVLFAQRYVEQLLSYAKMTARSLGLVRS